MLLEFFQALYRDDQGWVPVVRFPDSERNSAKPRADWRFNEYHWFAWPVESEKLVQFCLDHSHEDISVTTSVCAEKRNTKENVKAVNVIHCDADSAPPAMFAVEPSMIVQTSPGKTQLYWLLDRPMSPKKAEDIARRVAYSQRANGADMGWAVNKLMRVPGCRNTKPAYNNPKARLTFTGRLYEAKQLKQAFPRIPEGEDRADAPFPAQLPDLASVLARMPSTPELLVLFHEPPKMTSWNPNASRYIVLWKLGCSLFRLGFTREEVFTVLNASKSNKYEQDGRSPDELWKSILKMEVEAHDYERVVFVDEDEDHNPVSTEVTDAQFTPFLTDKERESLQPTLIDAYVDWASHKTNADKRYHVANAITVMSTLYSELAYANPKYGRLNLTVWHMVLGTTTLSYKTTAAKLMIRVLEESERLLRRPQPYLMGDEATPEGMTVELSGRGDDVSTLFHVDEAQGMVSDSQAGGKTYMSGMLRLLTKLYDGKVPARVRATQANTRPTRTFLTMNLLGVPAKMMRSLSTEDFASGFLPRFVFVIGTPASDDRQSLWLDQGTPTRQDTDDGFGKLMAGFIGPVMFWSRKSGGQAFPVMVEDDAWKRWNDFQFDMVQTAKESGHPDELIPGAFRTSVTTHKLACLLALSENKRQANMNHMLTAIKYAEEWFTTLRTMVSLVSSNWFSAQVRDIAAYVRGHNGKVLYHEVYKKFQNFKPREFAELIEAGVQIRAFKITRTGEGMMVET